jgi:predicted O-methyltransferase YrrM
VGINYLHDGSAATALNHWLVNPSDIADHLLFLAKHARGNILELGVRGGVSTSALLYGVEANGGHVWSVDIDPRCEAAFRGHPQWTFVAADSADIITIDEKGNAPFHYDILFIDTDHSYERLGRELSLWGPCVRDGGLILMHDVIAFPEMARAADEYASGRGFVYTVRPGSNGLGVIQC